MIEADWATSAGCQPRISWQLRSGRWVQLDGFYLDLTYAGLLEGRARAAMNERLVEELKARARSLFQEEPYLLPVQTARGEEGSEWLPPLRFVACLMSGPVAGGSGSVLVVAGFTPPFHDRALGEFLASQLADLPWEEYSRDFVH
jgi:hypothetical protein